MTAVPTVPVLCLIALAAGVLLWIAALIADDNQRLRSFNGRIRRNSPRGTEAADLFASSDRSGILLVPVSAVAIAVVSIFLSAGHRDAVDQTPQRLFARTVAILPAPAPPMGDAGSVPAPVQPAEATCDPVPLNQLRHLTARPAAEEGLDRGLLLALIYRESRFRPCAISPSGAIGLMQLKPATARLVGVVDPFDPMENIRGGSRYLSDLIRRFGGDLGLALSAYKQGPGTITGDTAQPVSEHTQRYVQDILDVAQSLDD